MNLQLQDKRALVTGSSSGIGAAIAKALAAEGASVVVQGRNEKAARRVADEIVQAGGRAVIALGDLAGDAQAAEVARQALAAFDDGRGVDILVNNAGAFPERGWWDATPAQWVELYNQNVASMVRTIQALVPGMKERGWGRVVNIASGAGIAPFARMADYAATKAANILLSVSLAKELAGTGVTANTVSPGPILTEGVETMFRTLGRERGWGEEWSEIEPKAVEAMFAQLSVRRFGRPEEIAAAVVFLSSPLAGYITGANLRVDGGFVGSVN